MQRKIVCSIFAGPFDGAPQPVMMIDIGDELQFIARFRRIAEAMTGTIPVARRLQRDRRCVAGKLVHALGELEDGDFNAGREIVGLARAAAQRAGDKPAHHDRRHR